MAEAVVIATHFLILHCQLPDFVSQLPVLFGETPTSFGDPVVLLVLPVLGGIFALVLVPKCAKLSAHVLGQLGFRVVLPRGVPIQALLQLPVLDPQLLDLNLEDSQMVIIGGDLMFHRDQLLQESLSCFSQLSLCFLTLPLVD